ncbi:hypothetical protein LNV09_07530 [Paucibacter sp. B2R-40]|uniref:hypothetical protein n=1 Tax=Paucibacter sp. B2R-40 TaxID=2893554 RepID=UPI0021E48C5C|nr:hypothetical protein [Paucibacter sp. B2R-40]MCV2354016.1 hypothetical protein [Paucibacter sp. B2R-40]
MKFLEYKLTAILLASQCLVSTPAEAQFVKGNDAVKVTAAGTKVETPPVPASVSKVCGADANCHAGSWRMIETAAGLVECTEPWARPGSCRGSSYGAQKLSRVWVVKRGKDWLQCQYPDLQSKCTPMFVRPPANLPFDAIQ